MIPGELGREVELHKTLLMGFIRCPIRCQVHGELGDITHFLKHEETANFWWLGWILLLSPGAHGRGRVTDSQDFQQSPRLVK